MDGPDKLTRKTRHLTELKLHELLSKFPPESDAAIRTRVDELRIDGQIDDLDVLGDKVVFGRELFLAAQQIGLDSLRVVHRTIGAGWTRF